MNCCLLGWIVKSEGDDVSVAKDSKSVLIIEASIPTLIQQEHVWYKYLHTFIKKKIIDTQLRQIRDRFLFRRTKSFAFGLSIFKIH